MLVGIVCLGIAPIEPPKGHGRLALAGRKLKANLGLERVALLVHDRRSRLDLRRIPQLERTEGHVDGMAGHVPQRAGAEILPPAPVERMIDSRPAPILALAFARSLGHPAAE